MKYKLVILVASVFLPCFAQASDAIKQLEARGVDRGLIEKKRMLVFESPKYKGLQAALYYCDLIKTKKHINSEINATKKVKGQSGYPSVTRLEHLDNSYATNSMDIKEQKKLYRAAYGKKLDSNICKNYDNLNVRLDKLHDQLLLEEFQNQPSGK